MLNRIFFFTLIVLLINSAGLQAQSADNRPLKVKKLYDKLQFEEAVKSGRESLRRGRSYDGDGLALIHRYMAYSFFNLSERDSARAHFLTLLSINPQTELDIVRTSPKIIAFFEQVRKEYEQLKSENKIIAVKQYVFVDDKRPGAAWRSALFPGWGQYYKNQKTKAYWASGLFLGGVVLSVISYAQEGRYKDLYLKETDSDKITSVYNRYNMYSKARRFLSYTTAAVWLTSFADALWSAYPGISIQSDGQDKLSFAYQIHF